jgi:hypothetical protein
MTILTRKATEFHAVCTVCDWQGSWHRDKASAWLDHHEHMTVRHNHV